MRSKYWKMISKLKIENEILLKVKNELDSKNDELKLNLECSKKENRKFRKWEFDFEKKNANV